MSQTSFVLHSCLLGQQNLGDCVLLPVLAGLEGLTDVHLLRIRRWRGQPGELRVASDMA
jgi:hypothetical protein